MNVKIYHNYWRMSQTNKTLDEGCNATKPLINVTIWHHIWLTSKCEKTLNEHHNVI